MTFDIIQCSWYQANIWYQYQNGTALFTTTKNASWFSVGNQQLVVSLCDFGTSQCILRDVWLICRGLELWCGESAPDSFVIEALKWGCISHSKTKTSFFFFSSAAPVLPYPQQHLQLFSPLSLTGSHIMAEGLTFANHWFDSSPVTMKWPSWSFRAEWSFQHVWGMRWKKRFEPGPNHELEVWPLWLSTDPQWPCEFQSICSLCFSVWSPIWRGPVN